MRNRRKIKGITIHDSLLVLPKPLGKEVKPKKLVLTLSSRWGILQCLVTPGTEVARGQLLAVDKAGIAPPLYSPCAGRILGVRPFTAYDGQEAPAILIQCSSSSLAEQGQNDTGAWKKIDPHTLIKKVHKAGVRETDNYTWPLAWRLAQPGLPPSDISNGPDISRPIEYLIINALDRQPGVCIRESCLSGREVETAEALSLLGQICAAKNTILAARKGQPISNSLEKELRQRGVRVEWCPPIYPIALEPLLVRYITGREIPMPQGDARMVGVAVVDIITALRVYRSIRDDRPALSTLIQLNTPGTDTGFQLWIPEGMIVSELLEQLQVSSSGVAKLIIGGPFLGHAQHTFDVPVTANVDSILIQQSSDVYTFENNPCVNCGQCVRACPMRLMPNELSRFCEYENLEAAEKNSLFHCIECGICAYVCPAKRPIVHLLRFGKKEILKKREASQET